MSIDRRNLGRTLTRLANASVAEVLAQQDAPAATRAARIGITGPPGAGKSSLVGRLAALRAAARRCARIGVLAIDPSSPRSGGAILGDRIRMDEIAGIEELYLRSFASRTAGDGLAQNIPELLHAMDLAGFDEVILETVGVGQAEHAVRHQVDTLVLVLHPESGDSIQAMKAGLMELADIYVVHKADLPGAPRLVAGIEQVLRLGGDAARRSPPTVLQTSISDPESIARLSAQIDRHLAGCASRGEPDCTHSERARYRLRSLLERRAAEVTAALPGEFFDAPIDVQFARAIEILQLE